MHPLPPSQRLQHVGMAVGLLALLCLPNHAYYHDAVADAGDVRFGSALELWHPHHLGASPVFRLWWLAGESLGLQWSAFDAMSILTRLATLLAVGQLWALARSAGVAAVSAALFSVIYGLSFSTWNFGTTGAVYPPALLGAWAILAHLLAILREGESAWAPARLGRITAWLLWAILWHQLAVFLIVPIAWCRWRTARLAGYEPLKACRSMLAVAVLLLSPPVVIYLVAGVLLFGVFSVPHLIGWATWFGAQSRWWFWSQIPEGTSFIQHWLATVLDSHARVVWAWPSGEPYPPNTTNPAWLALQRLLAPDFLWLLSLLLAMAVIYGGISLFRSATESSRPSRGEVLLVAMWIAPFFLFTAAFMPQNAFYRLYYLAPCLWLLVRWMDGLADAVRRQRSQFALLCAGWLSIVINLAYGWGPRMSREINPRLLATQAWASMPPGVLAIPEAAAWDDYVYARAFLDRPLADIDSATIKIPPPGAFEPIEEAERIWIHQAVLDRLPPSQMKGRLFEVTLKDARSDAPPATVLLQQVQGTHVFGHRTWQACRRVSR